MSKHSGQRPQFQPLPQVALAYGYELFKQNKGYACRRCPGCGESSDQSNKLSFFCGSDGRWRCNCFACTFRGDVLDFVAAVEGCSIGHAVAILEGRRPPMRSVKDISRVPTVVVGSSMIPSGAGVSASAAAVDAAASTPVVPVKGHEDIAAIRGIVRAVSKHFRDRETLDYLTTHRGLSRAMVSEAVLAGKLAALPQDPAEANRLLLRHVGKELLVRGGLLKTEREWAAAAFRPLIGMLPGGTAIQFATLKIPGRVMAGPPFLLYGEVRWPWVFRRREGGNLAMVEGYIDAMSILQMNAIPQVDAVLALPGAGSWKEAWLVAMRQQYPGGKLFVALDSDAPGEKAANAILDYAKTMDGLAAERARAPGMCKDWNLALNRSNSDAIEEPAACGRSSLSAESNGWRNR